MVVRYRYSGGEFIYINNKYEEWQGGEQKYFFEIKIKTNDQNWIYLLDKTRAISIKLPYSGGKSFIKWNDQWDDNTGWKDFHNVTVYRKGNTDPIYQLNSPTYTRIGRFNKPLIQSLSRTSAVLQFEVTPGKWHCFASGVLIHSRVLLTCAHPFENMRVTYPHFNDTDTAITFNFEYTADTADRKPKGELNLNRPWAQVRKVLEQGSKYGIDYALLLLRWEPQSNPNTISINVPIANRQSSMGENILAVQHPGYYRIGDYVDHKGINNPIYENPTQVSSGEVYDLDQAPHMTYGDKVTAFATFDSKAVGSSGGGVFDTTGKLIGIVGGSNNEKMSYFIQMNKIVARSRRLRILLGLEPYPNPFAPLNVTFPAPLLPEDLPFL